MTKGGPETDQIRTRTVEFGREYTDRNSYAPAQLDELCRRNYGLTRTELNQRFLEDIYHVPTATKGVGAAYPKVEGERGEA
jgi:hypothetical protein